MPLVRLIVAFVVGLIVFLPFPSWQQLVGFITSATVMSFASGPLVLSAMCKQIPEQNRPFRLPGGHVIPVLAFFSSNLIVIWSGWTVVWKLMVSMVVALALSLIIYAVSQRSCLDSTRVREHIEQSIEASEQEEELGSAPA